MHVAIVIVSYRNSGDVERCLAGLAKLDYGDFEVVVCENGGPAAYQALTAALPTKLEGGQPVLMLQAPGNIGYAAGVNLGMSGAPDADAWWVLNPDTVPDPHALTALLARLEPGDCHAVGCTVLKTGGVVQSHGGLWRPWLARAVSIGFGQAADAPVDAAAIERVQSYLNGACMLVDRHFLELVGPMREDYFLYCEEVEWFLRAARKGLKLGYAPDARVFHEAGTTTGSHTALRERPRTSIYYNERNKILLTRDMFPGRILMAAPAALALAILRYAPARAWRQLGYALSGWLAGLLGERGPQGAEARAS